MIYGENAELTKGQEDSIVKKFMSLLSTRLPLFFYSLHWCPWLPMFGWPRNQGKKIRQRLSLLLSLYLLSGSIRFVQELRSDKAASNLSYDCQYSDSCS